MTPTLTASAQGGKTDCFVRLSDYEPRKCYACGAKLEYLDETLCHRCAKELAEL